MPAPGATSRKTSAWGRSLDRYLNLDSTDPSDVALKATENVSTRSPGPLLDRMEILRIDAYTDEEKLSIVPDHLLRRQLERTAWRRATCGTRSG